MNFPKTSFISAFLLWFFLSAALCLNFFKKSQPPEISLTIDSEMIGKIETHEKSKTKEQKEESDLAKNSLIKKSKEEKLEPPSDSKKEEKNESENKITQKLAPLFQPLPQIPKELRDEAFSSSAIARFYISESGDVTKVELIKPCQNPRLNHLLLKSLQNWKFHPSSKSWTQDIRVTFKVE
jgi:TonB family protein